MKFVDGAESPSGSVFSAFRGDWVPGTSYYQGECVLADGELWSATSDILVTGPQYIGDAGASNVAAKTTTTSVTLPTGTLAGDMLLMFYALHPASSSASALSVSPMAGSVTQGLRTIVGLSTNVVVHAVFNYTVTSTDISAGHVTIPAQSVSTNASATVLDIVIQAYRNISGVETSSNVNGNLTGTTSTFNVAPISSGSAYEIVSIATAATLFPSSYVVTPTLNDSTAQHASSGSARGGLFVGVKTATSGSSTDAIQATINFATSNAFYWNAWVITLTGVGTFSSSQWTRMAVDKPYVDNRSLATVLPFTVIGTVSTGNTYIVDCAGTLPANQFIVDIPTTSSYDDRILLMRQDSVPSLGKMILTIGFDFTTLIVGQRDLLNGESVELIGSPSGLWYTRYGLVGATDATTSSAMLRDSSGRSQVAAPSAASDIANKSYADALGVSAPTVSTIMRRDAAGRAQVVAPSATGDIATKGYVDTGLTAAQTAAAALGVSAATASTIMRRDASGRAQVAGPSAGGDIVNKTYADSTYVRTVNGVAPGGGGDVATPPVFPPGVIVYTPTASLTITGGTSAAPQTWISPGTFVAPTGATAVRIMCFVMSPFTSVVANNNFMVRLAIGSTKFAYRRLLEAPTIGWRFAHIFGEQMTVVGGTTYTPTFEAFRFAGSGTCGVDINCTITIQLDFS